MINDEDVIRKLAKQIWEAEGKPDGLAEKHWQRACILAARADSPDDAKLKRSIDPSQATGPTEPVQPDQT